ncbi:hypothetical protein SpCBS45565_g02416 [Spizellomyces sp. 'palustris']|nr:hypothetical protein SpCBS45565_g02416 [Spizellomyces sp. 'palustris']
MDWLKKTAGRIKHAQPHQDRPTLSIPSTVEVGRFEVSQTAVGCCALGGRHDGTFGDDDEGWRIRRLWKSYDKHRKRKDIHGDPESPEKRAELGGLDADASEANPENDLLTSYLRAFGVRFGPLTEINEIRNMSKMFPVSHTKHGLDPKQSAGFPFSRHSTTGSTPPSKVTSPLAPPALGHPHVAVLGMIEVLENLAAEHHDKLVANPANCEILLSRTLHVLQHMEVLSRFDGNRDAMVQHGAIKTIALIITRSGHVNNANQDRHDRIREATESTTTILYLSLALMIIQRCSDAEAKWEQFVRNGGRERANEDTGHLPRRGRGSAPFSEPTTRHVLDALFVLLTEGRHTLNINRLILIIHTINALGCLLVTQGSTVSAILTEESHKLEVLCNMVGDLADAMNTLSVESISDTNDENVTALRYHFIGRLLAWYLVELLSAKDPPCREHMKALNWPQKVANFLVWTAAVAHRCPQLDDSVDGNTERYYSVFPETRHRTAGTGVEGIGGMQCPLWPIPALEPSPDDWGTMWPSGSASVNLEHIILQPLGTEELELVFLLDEMFCLNDCHNSWSTEYVPRASAARSSGFGDISASSIYQQVDEENISSALHHALKMMYDIFADDGIAQEDNCFRRIALGYAEDYCPRLQLGFIKLLAGFVIHDKDTAVTKARISWLLKWMDDLNVWELLLGPRFYMWRTAYADERAIRARQTMRTSILTLIVYCGTLAEDSNDRPCQALLSLLSKHQVEYPEIIRDTCGALCLIIRARPVTQETFRRLNAFETLLPVLTFCTSESVTDVSYRFPIFALFKSVLANNKEMSIYAFLNRPILSSFFTLLGSSHVPTSCFAQRRIFDIVTVLATDYPTYGRWGIIVQPSLTPTTPMTPATPDQETTPEVMRRYLECFPGLIDQQDKLDLQLRLLRGIRDFVGEATEEISVALKRALSKAKVFQFLMSVLSVKVHLESSDDNGGTSSNSEYHELVEMVLFTVATLIRDDEMAKKSFRELHGYDEIRTRICLKGGWQCWPGLLNSLFFLLADGRDAPYRVRNFDVVDALFQFYEHCNQQLRGQMICELDRIAAAHEPSKAALHCAGIVNKILRTVLPMATDEDHLQQVMQLLKTVATYSLTVAEVKLLLKCLRRRDLSSDRLVSSITSYPWSSLTWSEQRHSSVLDLRDTETELPSWYDALVRTVVEIAQRQVGDLDLFCFDGTGGMIAKGLDKWPVSAGGWSFMTWIWIDAEEGGGDNTKEESTVFALRTSTGDNGLDISLLRDVLTVRVTKAHRPHVASVTNYPLAPNQWHSVVISHGSPKLPWTTSSEALVYINGVIRWREKLEYPDVAAYSIARVGASAPVAALSQSNTSLPLYANSFTGQMTSIYLLDDILSHHQAMSVHQLGPSQASRLGKGSNARSAGADLENMDADRVVMQFHPMATRILNVKGKRFYSSKKGRKHSKIPQGKEKMAGIVTSATKCFCTAVHALGGVGILIPILAQVDLKAGYSGTAQSSTQVSCKVKDENAIKISRTRLFFDLLATVISGDPVHQDRLAAMSGPKVMSSLLQQNNPAGLGLEVLDALINVAQASFSHLALFGDMEKYLIFDSRIWTHAAEEVQIEYYQSVHQLLARDIEKYRDRYGAGFWVDVLEKFYRYTGPNMSELTQPLESHRGSRESTTLLRRFIFGIIKEFLLKSPSADDVWRIVQVLSCSDDNVHIAELLSVVVEISVHHPESRLAERFLGHGGGESLFLLSLNNTLERTRVLALQMMLVTLKSHSTSDKWRKRIKLEEVGWLGSTVAVGNAGGSGPGVLARILVYHSFTAPIYYAFLQLALEEQVLDWETQEVLVAPVELRNAKIKNVGYIQTLLELAAGSGTTIKLRIEVLRDILVLGCRNGNGESIRRIARWQSLLMALFDGRSMRKEIQVTQVQEQGGLVESSGESQPPEISNTSSQADETRLSNLGFETLTTFTLDTFDLERKSWRCVEEIAISAWLTKREDEAYTFLRTFLLRLLSAVKGEIGGGDWRNFSGAKMENIAHLLLFVEEFMFNHHDLRDALMRDLHTEDPKRLFFVPNLRELLSTGPPGAATGDLAVRMSFPLGECRDLVEEYLEVLSSLIDFGITHVHMTDGAEKSHLRSGGLVRLAIRILLSAFTVPEESIWHMALRHLIPLLDKHAMTFSEGKVKERGFYVLGHVHEIFVVAQRSRDVDGEVSKVDHRIVLPLYMLVMTRWREAVASLVEGSGAGDAELISETLLNEALADQQIFNHLVTSPVWDSVYDTSLFPAMKMVEEDEFAMVPLVTRRFTRMSRSTCTRWAKEEAALERAKEFICGILERVSRKRRGDENQRNADCEKEEELEKRMVGRQLCLLWRTLTQERGMWAPVEDGNSGSKSRVKWKLDRAENHLRMRRRLTPNWEFDDHVNASAKRDKTFKPDDGVSRGESPRLSRASTFSSISAVDRKRSQMDKLRSQIENGMGIPPDLLKEVSITSLGSLAADDDNDLGEEEWSVLNEDDLLASNATSGATGSASKGDRLLYSADCEMILLMTPVKGRIEVTASHLTFTADIKATTLGLCESEREAVMILLVDNDALLKERRWSLDDLCDCYLRRYMLRKSAVELFFSDKTNYLFNFPGAGKTASKDRLKFLKCLVSCRPVQLANVDVRSSPGDVVKKSSVTEQWVRREISNFEYLMWLNTVSGRTYNDLTQYPVFPWIIRDYESETLDITDPSIYRDLSKPVGALDETRLAQYLERYKAFEDPTGRIKKFHYGTHYSSAAAVVFYLLRLEPFTTLHITLQGGKFDHPDRQFHSLRNCWKSVLAGSGDVKELIPEFFYMPEFLTNDNRFDLGVKQTGEVLDDVILPPWSKTPEDFVRIHREALESDFVSEHLNEWIDLIWGYKQTGEEAVKAHNVFYYLTYEGAINIDAIKDPMERRSIEDQINNFGQTPSQLFKKPHPKRAPENECEVSTLFDAPEDHRSYLIESKGAEIHFIAAYVDESVVPGGGGTEWHQGLHRGSRLSHTPALPTWAGSEGKKVITVDGDMCFRAHKWSGGIDAPFAFEADNTALRKRKIPNQLASTTHPHSQLFAVTHNGRYLISGGSWDASFQVIQLDLHHGHGSPQIVDVVHGHRDIVTCIAIGEDDRTIASGSADTTVMTWEIDGMSGCVEKARPRVFCGHDDQVTAVAVNVEHGIVVSGSKDGSVIIHTLHDARYLRTLRPLPSKSSEILCIHRVLITSLACIVVYTEAACRETSTPSGPLYSATIPVNVAPSNVCYLHTYTINGKPVHTRMFITRLSDIKASRDGGFLVGADEKGGILVMKTPRWVAILKFELPVNSTLTIRPPTLAAFISHTALTYQ